MNGRASAFATFAARRLLETAATLLVASFAVFGALYLAPGDPAAFLLSGRSASAQQLEILDREYHLNEPFIAQYGRWLGQVVHGDFGRSIEFRTPVSTLLGARIPNTLALVGLSLVLVIVFGLALGWISAVRGGRLDSAILVGTTVAVGTPSFVAAILLQGLFAVKLHWLPAGGDGSGLLGGLRSMILPATALALYMIGLLSRVTRSAMLEVLEQEHVIAARSRGVPERAVVRRHVLRNCLSTILTMSGLIISTLVVCTVLVESAFDIDGVGQLLDLSSTTKDFPTVQAISLLIIALFMVVNVIVDLLLPFADPRITLGTRAA